MKTKKTVLKLFMFFILIFSLQLASFAQTSYNLVIDSIVTRINTAPLRQVVRELSGDTTCIIGGNTYTLLTRAYNQPENELAAQYILERFLSYGLDTSTFQFSSTGKNVIGKKLGVKYPNQIYIIGAHYDSYPWEVFAPGADDNATGVAGVLEAAKQLMNYDSKYTLLFVGWDEEERGLYGSHAYADTAFMHGDSIKGVINIDMLGYDPNNQRNIVIYTDANSLSLANIMYSTDRIYVLDMNPTININPAAGASDHYSFWQTGYKAVWPFENPVNPYVNNPADSIELLNMKYFTRMVKGAVAAFATLAFDFMIDIEHQPLASTPDTNARIATAIIKSGQGIAAGEYSPRLYYKTGNGLYNFVNSSFNNLDTFKFIIPGEQTGSTVYYYIAAQDSTGQLVQTYPPGGFGFNPPGTEPPAVPLSYKILGSLSYCSITVPRDIPPRVATYDSIYIPRDFILFGLTVNLTINYPNDQDLLIGVVNPSGELLKLSYGNGGSGANYINTTFDDAAVDSIKNGIPPFTGSYMPEQKLSQFNNQSMQGYWRLRVYNLSLTGTGQLVSWCLNGYYYNPIGIVGNQVPVKTSLSQNYPNPFNPNTRISFTLERTTEVKLAVYDILGREVSVLINGKLNSGDHKVDFNGSELSSGVYFYTLYLNGSRFDTKKMVLIK